MQTFYCQTLHFLNAFNNVIHDYIFECAALFELWGQRPRS
jgi:hypothetical protein